MTSARDATEILERRGLGAELTVLDRCAWEIAKSRKPEKVGIPEVIFKRLDHIKVGSPTDLLIGQATISRLIDTFTNTSHVISYLRPLTQS